MQICVFTGAHTKTGILNCKWLIKKVKIEKFVENKNNRCKKGKEKAKLLNLFPILDGSKQAHENEWNVPLLTIFGIYSKFSDTICRDKFLN